MSERHPGERLRALRENADLTLREAAKRSGLDPSHLRRVEHGDARLSVESLARLLEVIGPPEHIRVLRLYAYDDEPAD